MFVDSSAAIGIANRKGIGKMRHVRVGMMWIQEKSEEGELEFNTIEGERNPADMMTKNLTKSSIGMYMTEMYQIYEEGRAKSSPKV